MSSPKTLIIFDLDYTLWPFWVDTHVTAPFRKTEKGHVVDSDGKRIEYYPDVPKILQRLVDDGYTLGVASRTAEIFGANQLIKLFDWDKYFKYKEIYPGSKINHFNKFQSNSGMPYKNMIFFDDESRNINEIRKLGVTSVFVKNGMNLDVLRQGLEMYKKSNSLQYYT